MLKYSFKDLIRNASTGDIIIMSKNRWYTSIMEYIFGRSFDRVFFIIRSRNNIYYIDTVDDTDVTNIYPIQKLENDFKNGLYTHMWHRKIISINDSAFCNMVDCAIESFIKFDKNKYKSLREKVIDLTNLNGQVIYNSIFSSITAFYIYKQLGFINTETWEDCRPYDFVSIDNTISPIAGIFTSFDEVTID